LVGLPPFDGYQLKPATYGAGVVAGRSAGTVVGMVVAPSIVLSVVSGEVDIVSPPVLGVVVSSFSQPVSANVPTLNAATAKSVVNFRMSDPFLPSPFNQATWLAGAPGSVE
jgi:hypothetical protein